ncbi:MAG: hypothetical protein HOW73_37360 [Polyangiaceae bacterium]|nr:hypothetical protein [Polyangiaceae bacterium]
MLKLGCFACTSLVVALFSTSALADGLAVATDVPPAPTAAAPAPIAAPVAQPVADTNGKAAEPKVREGVVLGGSAYFMQGVAVDDFESGGYLARAAMELYASIGAGDVSVLLGGTVLGVEAAHFGSRSSLDVPLLVTVGVRSDDYIVAMSGGVSVGSDNSYVDREDAEESLPSPRAEVRAGFRMFEILEITGIVGVERQLYTNRDNTTRLMGGVALGIGGDG